MFDRQLKIAASQGPQTTPATGARRTKASGSQCRRRVRWKSSGRQDKPKRYRHVAAHALHAKNVGSRTLGFWTRWPVPGELVRCQVVQALSKVQLALGPGVLGLLGPNGAGKSTLMRILATITQPSSGRVSWNDVEIAHHPDPLRTVLGYLPQDFGVYPNLNALEFLEYLAAVKGMQTAAARKRIGELLELVNLTEVAKRPLGGYSGGMRQRIGIAQTLLSDPQLLTVDEPTSGLDPEERLRFRNLLSELSGERIVILSTHIVSDVEAVASSIAILAHGHLIAHDVPEALLASVAGKVWQVVVPSSELYALRQKHLVSSTAHRSNGVHARVVADAAPENAARPLDPVLEDAYLSAVAQRRSAANGAEA